MVILNRKFLEKSYKNLYSKKEIDLSNEDITSIDKDTFKGLTNLTKINLGNNCISFIHPKILRGLTNLEQIDLSHNLIKELDEKQFYGLTSLTEIFLHDNDEKLMHNQKMVLYLEKSVIKFSFHCTKNIDSIGRIQNVIKYLFFYYIF